MSDLAPRARAYIAILAVTAGCVAISALNAGTAPSTRDLVLAMILATMIALAYLYPLQFAVRTRLQLDTSVVFAAVLLFPPGMAIVVAVVGVAVAEAVRREDWAQGVFNPAQAALQAAAGGIVLSLVGWNHASSPFDQPVVWAGIVAAGIAMHLTNTMAVAAIIGFQEGIAARRVWVRSSTNLGRAEIVAHLAQFGLGLLAAIVVRAEPWALTLLVLPAAAVHQALHHHQRLRLLAEQDLHQTQTDLSEAQRIAHLGSWTWDLATGRNQWSEEVFRILGVTPGQIEPSYETLMAAVHPDDQVAVRSGLRIAVEQDIPFSLDVRMGRADGDEAIVHARGGVVRDAEGLPVRFVGTFHDITERKLLESRLAQQAFHDPLTGLPNRALFTDRLERALARSKREGSVVGLLYLDLDRFKRINDSLGHEAGDRLLVEVGHRLQRCVRPTDTVARLGGDEFTVLLDPGDAATAAAERILRAFDELFAIGHNGTYVATSVGVATSGPERTTSRALLHAADDALYRAKQQGRGRFVVYDPESDLSYPDRVELEADLRLALERDELRLLYQPTIDLTTGCAVSVEAFLHWAHPRRGMLAPPTFLAIAEETGLILALGRWALGEACRQGKRWVDRCGDRAPIVSVNLAAREFTHPDSVKTVARVLAASGLPPGHLVLEIGEDTVMADPESSVGHLWSLAGLGVRIAIDDFGTGQSSLSHLSRFPLDALKIDRSFVDRLGRDAAATTITEAVVSLAHSLGLRVVAVGVETPSQYASLRRLGCEWGQGHLFAHSLAATEIETMLVNGAPLPLPTIALPLPTFAAPRARSSHLIDQLWTTPPVCARVRYPEAVGH